MKFYIDGPIERSYKIAKMYDMILFANHELVDIPRNRCVESVMKSLNDKENVAKKINSILSSNIFVHVSDAKFYDDTFYLGLAMSQYISKGNPFIYVIGDGISDKYDHPIVNRIKDDDICVSLEKILLEFQNSKD